VEQPFVTAILAFGWQDIVAWAVALAAAGWLARLLWRQLQRPSCGGGGVSPPAGSDGFVPLEQLDKK
jgi:hypothetical protein